MSIKDPRFQIVQRWHKRGLTTQINNSSDVQSTRNTKQRLLKNVLSLCSTFSATFAQWDTSARGPAILKENCIGTLVIFQLIATNNTGFC
jgi:hypothetical protein